HELFERRVKEHPHRVALASDMRELTYDELNHRADRLAFYLKNQGFCPGALIGLCLERSVTTVVALLGILKAGGAYLPLDPHQPAARLQYVLKDSGVQLVLTEEKWIAKLSNLLWYGGDQLLLAMDADWPVLDLSALRKQPALLASGQPACVVYTSAS